MRLRRLAAELRELRKLAGLSQDEVSKLTNINSATLYRIETAKVRPQRRTLLTLLDHYGVTDSGRRDDLVAMARQANQLGWLQAYEMELPEEYTTYISFEAEARSVRNYETSFIPGLLQTADYARAVVTASLQYVASDEIEQRVETRLQRQHSINRSDPLKLWAILDEAVLHRQVGSKQLMAAQLRRLLEAAAEPNITVQVIPYRYGAHPGMHGAFAIMDFPGPEDADLVYIENMAGATYLEKEADVRRYAEMFDRLRAAALSPPDSGALVAELVD